MSMKSNAYWADFIETIRKEYGVKIEVTKDSLRDLSHYYSRREHHAVAEEIEDRIHDGMYPPPTGNAAHLDAPDQMYGKIKNRKTGLRIIYFPYYQEEVEHFMILVVGPRADNKVYDLLSSRLNQMGRPEKDLLRAKRSIVRGQLKK